MAYFVKWTFGKSGPLEKVDTGPFKEWTLCQNSRFWSKTSLWQIRGCWFQIWQYFFKFTAQNTQIRQFWCQNWIHFFVLHIFFFAFRQILGCWFHLSQSLLPICSLKILKRTYLVSSLRIYIFARNFLNLQLKNTEIRHS